MTRIHELTHRGGSITNMNWFRYKQHVIYHRHQNGIVYCQEMITAIRMSLTLLYYVGKCHTVSPNFFLNFFWHFREGFQKNKAWPITMLQNVWPEGVKYNPKSQFWNSDILFRHPPSYWHVTISSNSEFCKIPTYLFDQCH